MLGRAWRDRSIRSLGRAVEDAVRNPKHPPRGVRRAHPLLLMTLLLIYPGVVGLGVGRRWPNISSDAYGVIAQTIATLLIAIVFEFFARDRPLWEDRIDQATVLLSVAVTWTGVAACLRGMLDGGSAWTAGLATAGVASAAVLISLSMVTRTRGGEDRGVAALVLLVAFLAPPMVLLVIA
jgi:hypothetical protein